MLVVEDAAEVVEVDAAGLVAIVDDLDCGGD